MDTAEIQKKCMQLLEELGVPGFIVFGYKTDEEKFGVAYATHEVPPNAAIKGMLWAAHDFANRNI